MFVVMLVETHLEDSSSPAWRRLAEFLYLRAGGLGLCCHHCHHCAVAVITTELTLRENLETQSQPKKIRKKLTKFWNLRPKNAVIYPLKITLKLHNYANCMRLKIWEFLTFIPFIYCTVPSQSGKQVKKAVIDAMASFTCTRCLAGNGFYDFWLFLMT